MIVFVICRCWKNLVFSLYRWTRLLSQAEYPCMWVCLYFLRYSYDVCITAVDQPQCYTFKAWKNHSNYWVILVIMQWYVFLQVNHRSICVCLFTESSWFGRHHLWVEYIFCFFCHFLMIYLWFWSFEDGQLGKINTFLTNTFILWLLLHRTIYLLFFLSVDALIAAHTQVESSTYTFTCIMYCDESNCSSHWRINGEINITR